MSDAQVMAEASHTPGPWEAKHIDANHLVIESQTGSVAKTLIPLGLNDVAATVRANARLIAAAPELLAALKEMGDWVAGGLQASDKAWPDARCLQHTEEIAARARAAVDKAEGRS